MIYMYQFVGGRLNGIYQRDQVIDNACGTSTDYTVYRSLGCTVPRMELDNQPEFPGYIGPMFDGERILGTDGKWHYTFDRFTPAADAERSCVIRYETQEVYNALSH